MTFDDIVIKSYRAIFARRIFYKFNYLMFQSSLRGLGVLNYENDDLSGETAFKTSWLKNGNECMVLDVGANVGRYSAEIFQINPLAKVHAFEPHPTTYAKLTSNVVREGFWPHNVGVGDEDGVLSLYDYADQDGSSHASLYKDVIEELHKAKSVEHKVQIISLGDFIRSNGIARIDLLKIDTEGNELNVLKGVGGYLGTGQIRAIHLEFNEMNVMSRTYFKDFWDILPNYDFYRMLPDGLAPIRTYSPLVSELFAYQNIVAVFKGELSGRRARGYFQ